MKGLFRNVMLLVGLSSGLYGGSAYAVDVQVAGGLVTLGSAEISQDAYSTFGYKVDSYSGTQLGLTLIWDDKSSLMLNLRKLKGSKPKMVSGFTFDEMKRTDTTIAYSRAFLEPFFGVDGGWLIGWKTGSSHVTASGTDYFNFSSSGPLLGANLSHKFSSSLVGKGDVSYQFITGGSYRSGSGQSLDKPDSSSGIGLGLGLAYLINESFSTEVDYKYSLNTYNFPSSNTASYSGMKEKISHIELTAKYKF